MTENRSPSEHLSDAVKAIAEETEISDKQYSAALTIVYIDDGVMCIKNIDVGDTPNDGIAGKLVEESMMIAARQYGFT